MALVGIAILDVLGVITDLQQPVFGELAGVRPEEAPAVLWSMLYVIALFLAYYVLCPPRSLTERRARRSSPTST